MSDRPVLDFLQVQFARLNDRLDGSDRKQDEIITRLGSVERDLAGLRTDFVGLQSRLDSLDRRFTRIERRLDLTEAPAAGA